MQEQKLEQILEICSALISAFLPLNFPHPSFNLSSLIKFWNEKLEENLRKVSMERLQLRNAIQEYLKKEEELERMGSVP